jgi:Protein of unknown function (DUF2971)
MFSLLARAASLVFLREHKSRASAVRTVSMIFDRWYDPKDDELIYHYCAPTAFIEIIRTRAIWLSASYTMNDATERSWGYAVFQEVAMALEKETGTEFIKHVISPVAAGDHFSLLMLACFSLDADVLGQWRAYGDNGRGFAIGFAPRLMKLPAKQLSVLYEKDAQIKELTGNLRHIYELEKNKGFTYDDEFQNHMFHFGNDLCAYKNPGFREEREIRLAHLSGMNRDAKTAIPLGARGPKGEKLSDPLPIQFRSANGLIVPYVIADYTNKGALSPVKEVVLGPRNVNAELNIEMFLNTLQIDGVTVRRSEVPYC